MAVELNVRTQLNKLIAEMDRLKGSAQELEREFESAGKNVGESLEASQKGVERNVSASTSLMRRAFDQLKSDLKTLASIEGLRAGLGFTDQFRSTISETVSLSDAIRKFGDILGVERENFVRFQSTLTKGMGEIGLSSQAAANAIAGLAETPVRGEEAIEAYTRLAGTLAQISGQQGREGELAGGIARIIQARGGNVQDVGQAQGVAEDVLRARAATGRGPTEIIKTMEEIFRNMSEDLRKKIGTRGLAQVSAVARQGGPDAVEFFKQFVRLSKTQRAGLEARGLGGVVTEQGIDVDQLRKFVEEARKLGGGDFRVGVKAMGIEGDAAAEGLIRLAENLDKVEKTVGDFNNKQIDMNKTLRESLGLGEAFRANINRIKGLVSGPMSEATQGLTDLLSEASKSDVGAGAVVGGAGALAALLAGAGLRGIGKGLGVGGLVGTFAKGKAAEAITGQEVQPVYVVNAAEIGAAGALGSAGGLLNKVGGVKGLLKGAGMLGLAGGAGYAAGSLIEPHLPTVSGKTEEGFEGGLLERLFFKLDKLLGGETSETFMRRQEVIHKLKMEDPRLKETKQPTRGATQ